MSDTPQGPGWWLASDGRYYPPQPPAAPSAATPPTADQPPAPGQTWTPPGQPGATASTPLPPHPLQPGGPSGNVGTPVPPARSPKDRRARVLLIVLGLVVAAVALGVVAVAVGIILLRGDDADDVVVDASTTTLLLPEPSLPEPTVAPGDPELPQGDADVVATEVGFSMGERFDGEQAATAGAVIRNTGDSSAAFFEVVFTFTDDAGATVGTETTYVYAIEPGGTAHAAVDAVSLQGPASGVDAVVVLEEDPGFWTGTVVPVRVSGVTVDEFFGLQVEGTATNPTTVPIQAASVQCVVRDGGAIVGGASAVLDTIVPGGEVAWEAITFSDWLRGDSAECSGGTYG